MKRRLTISLLLALAASALPGVASAGYAAQSEAIAQAAGVTARDVRHLMGWPPLTYYEFRSDHSRITSKLIRNLGKDRYLDLMAGKPVRIEHEVDGRVVVYIVQREPQT